VEKLGDKNGRLVKGRSLSTKKITVPYKCKGKASTVAYKNEAIFPDLHGGPSPELNQNRPPVLMSRRVPSSPLSFHLIS
jgi:hypothetical protein